MRSSDRPFGPEEPVKTAGALLREANAGNVFVLPRRPELGAPDDDSEVASASDSEAQTARSAEVFLRTSYATQMALHGMADNKSRMLIQMNGVVLSVLLASETPLLSVAGLDGWATATLLFTSVLSMAMALLAARPPRRQGGAGEVRGEWLNVIGRSDFAVAEAGVETSIERFAALTRDVDAINRGLLHGLHRLGEMLEAKHRLLRLAYLTFGLGMTITAAIYGWTLTPLHLP